MLRGPRVLLLAPTLVAAAVAASLMAPAGAATGSSLTVTPRGSVGTVVTGNDQLATSGSTLAIGITSVAGGQARIVDGPDGALPRAVQFPSYVASGTYPRAVAVLDETSGTSLSPGSSDFQYGAVFRLDQSSSGRTDDNGDNLFQRGLFKESAAFKLQVDHRRPSCLVKGSTGRLLAKSPVTVTPGAWYRVTCSRVGSRVSIAVSGYGSSSFAPTSTSRTGGTGWVSFATGRPASLGGKINARGRLVARDSDQFNGAVAQVWVDSL